MACNLKKDKSSHLDKPSKGETVMHTNTKLKDLTLIEIMKNKRSFTKSQQPNHFINQGELEAYNEMIRDVEKMTENEFVNKYLQIVKDIEQKFFNNEINNQEEDHMLGGFNNAVVDVLIIINPIYMEELTFRGYESDELLNRPKG